MLTIRQISFSSDLKDVQKFFESNCGTSSHSFTYFKKRTYDVIEKHIATFLAYDNFEPIGYSHLDVEDGIVWFGICIGEKYRGRGLGEKLILVTLEEAAKKAIPTVLLSVYKDNLAAINLYKKVGFEVFKENDLSFFMKKG
jgi:ribosomal protein S18 acetylase RimI-like enzyme